MSESKKNPKALVKGTSEEMITVIVSEIHMAPVAERYPMTVAVSEMAKYYGVDSTKEAVVRALQADCNRQFRPTKGGTLMLADVAPQGWNGDMDSLPVPDWATDDDELARIGGRVPGMARALENGDEPTGSLFE